MDDKFELVGDVVARVGNGGSVDDTVLGIDFGAAGGGRELKVGIIEMG